jgi:uncharacterized membrane protein YqjE
MTHDASIAAPPTAAPSVSALLRIVRGAGGALLVQTGLHAQLLQVEWRETRIRLLKMLAAGLLGFTCLLCLMLALGALLVALSWATPWRLAALGTLIALYAGGALYAWRRFESHAALGATSFAASRAQLAADLAMLRSQL